MQDLFHFAIVASVAVEGYWTRRCRIYDFELGHLGTLNFCYTPFVFHSLKKLWFEYHTFIFPCSIGQVGSGKICSFLRGPKPSGNIGRLTRCFLPRTKRIIQGIPKELGEADSKDL